VRHGATANNLEVPAKIQGCGSDLGLSQEGRQQAELTAQFLASQPLQAAFSSPLARAWETAQIIAQPHGLAVQRVDQLQEVDVGRWEGRSWQEIARLEPDAHRRFVTDPEKHGYAGGENLAQVRERVIPCMERVMHANLGKAILVVAHNVVNRTLLATMLQLPVARARGIAQDNCGVNVIRFRDGNMKLLTANAAFHLQVGR
jgi:broad specificity phosphatase PhoE